MSNQTELTVNHYQNTYEITQEMWKQRNRIFIYLLAMIGIDTILTFGTYQTNTLLVDLIAKILNITDSNRIHNLYTSFPYNLINSIILIIVFYLMVNLYHHSRFVIRSYLYLGELEKEIRQNLDLKDTSVAFTRESNFYWKYRDDFSGIVKWAYISLLGGLLFIFLGGRIFEDFKTNNVLFIILDLIVSALTLIFFIGYSFSSVKLEYKSKKFINNNKLNA